MDMLINGKAKVLMLHGHAESGPSFHARTKRLETHLHNTFPAAPHRKHHPLFPGGIELHYPTGPVKLTPGEASRSDGPKKEFRSHSPSDPFRSPLRERAESDAYAWGVGDLRKTEDVEGLNNSITFALEYIQANGPFVGVVGFSSGATLAVILTSLLEHPKSVKGFEYPPNFNHPPLYFALCYSGFKLTSQTYKPLYNPKIATPTLHVIGSMDRTTEEAQTLALVKKCRKARVVYHPGTHYVPTRSAFLEIAVEFVEEALGGGVDEEYSDWED